MASVGSLLGYLPMSLALELGLCQELDAGTQPCALHCCCDSVLDSKGEVHVLGGMGQHFPVEKEEGLLSIKLEIHANKK